MCRATAAKEKDTKEKVSEPAETQGYGEREIKMVSTRCLTVSLFTEESSNQIMSPPTASVNLLTSPDVVPIRVVGSQLLVSSGLDDINPVGDLEFTGSLQVGRVSGDEVLSGWKRSKGPSARGQCQKTAPKKHCSQISRTPGMLNS